MVIHPYQCTIGDIQNYRLIKSIENDIDTFLKSNWNQLEIAVNFGISIPLKDVKIQVKNYIVRRYHEAGWILVFEEDQSISISERTL